MPTCTIQYSHQLLGRGSTSKSPSASIPPNNVLSEHHATIQQIHDLCKIIPFGIKVVVRNENPASKVDVTGHAMRALTFKSFSDAVRVLDSSTGKVRITQDYAQLKSEKSVILWKDPSSLPLIANPPQLQVATLPVLKGQTSSANISNSNRQAQYEPLPQTEDHSPSSMAPVITCKPRYDYVPHYDTSLHNISSNLDAQNILRDEKRQRRPPDQLMLADLVTYKHSLFNPE
ncbi:hypothetical protein O181_005952 [Austropuccinia psidii MF-1]|uniref:Uncharacterized protein n=1 Tax=Austropuccinia psidii MF-1 TaxID=1389203 RepID=A0A9Q3BJ35_9BASI|nr:hypothetical protein [Austropuccinia psidii MF-1]